MKSFRLSSRDIEDYCAITQKKSTEVSERVIVIVAQGRQAVQKWKELMGPSNPVEARKSSPDSIRAQLGKDESRNAVSGSEKATVKDEISFFFGNKRILQSTTTLSNSTCCVIKPHAITEGKTGQILQSILESGFQIGAIEQFRLETNDASEFYEIYQGVVPEYKDMVTELCSGFSIAVELLLPKGYDHSPVELLRELVGPADSSIAKQIRPNTLRARFGSDKIKNAVHCTDLPEDGVTECEYFFKILQ